MDETTVENDLHDTGIGGTARKRVVVSNLLFAMAGILLVLIVSVLGWNHDRTHDPEGTALYILCAAMAILFGLVSCLRAVARYWISVSPTEMTFEMTTLLTRDIRRYARSEVANLRVGERRVFTLYGWRLTGMENVNSLARNSMDRSWMACSIPYTRGFQRSLREKINSTLGRR
ncbi:MAG TPA: hypothetical protein VGJ30_06840 [Candidatus Angelobacter sp.]|jgi:hypothetical protein